METIFMNMENSKTNEPHKFILNLSQILDLRSSDKHVALQNLCIMEETIAPIWNYKFELQHGSYSVSDIQYYIEFIIKKHKKLTTVPPIHV